MLNAQLSTELIIAQAALSVSQRYNAFLEDPHDPETNHKLRVSIRTLRSLLTFLRPWQKRKQAQECQANLKRLVRKTSRLRELDVLSDMVAEKNCSHDLQELCMQAAADERYNVLQWLSKKKQEDLLAHTAHSLCRFKWKATVEKEGLPPSALRTAYKELYDEVTSQIESLNVEDYEALHSARKRAKQTRYVAEQFEGMLDASAKDQARTMKEEQDRLGALCDQKVNRDIITSFLQEQQLPEHIQQELTVLLETL